MYKNAVVYLKLTISKFRLHAIAHNNSPVHHALIFGVIIEKVITASKFDCDSVSSLALSPLKLDV